MRFLAVMILLGLFTPFVWAVQASQQPAGADTSKPAASAQSPDEIQTETVKIPESLQAPPVSMANQPGYMVPAQTHALLAKIWQAESRAKDLLTQVHPEQWKISDPARAAFAGNLDMLRRNLAALEERRLQFDGRVDSDYLGFETYAGISQVLPPLGALADAASRHHDFALAAEVNQAWNDMLTMQQALKPYLSFLLRNHDQTFLIIESNLAGCQNELNYAKRGASGRAQPMRNIPPAFKGRRVHKKAEASKSAGGEEKKP